MIAQILLLKNAFFQAHPGMQKKKKKTSLTYCLHFIYVHFPAKMTFF